MTTNSSLLSQLAEILYTSGLIGIDEWEQKVSRCSPWNVDSLHLAFVSANTERNTYKTSNIKYKNPEVRKRSKHFVSLVMKWWWDMVLIESSFFKRYSPFIVYSLSHKSEYSQLNFESYNLNYIILMKNFQSSNFW